MTLKTRIKKLEGHIAGGVRFVRHDEAEGAVPVIVDDRGRHQCYGMVFEVITESFWPGVYALYRGPLIDPAKMFRGPVVKSLEDMANVEPDAPETILEAWLQVFEDAKTSGAVYEPIDQL